MNDMQGAFLAGMIVASVVCYLLTFIQPKPICHWCRREIDRRKDEQRTAKDFDNLDK